MLKCKHENTRVIKTDKGGIFISPSFWCRECGALKTSNVWIMPKQKGHGK